MRITVEFETTTPVLDAKLDKGIPWQQILAMIMALLAQLFPPTPPTPSASK